MSSSASASSSAVVTPGSTASPIAASVSATTAPARAIVSISSGDLRMIIARPPLSSTSCTSSKTSSIGRSAWIPTRFPASAVVRDEVARAPAASSRRWRIISGVSSARPRVERAPSSRDRHLLRQLEVEHDRDRRGRARRASRRAPRPARASAGSRRGRSRRCVSGWPSRSRIELDDELVGHEVAAVVGLLDLAAELGPVRDRRADHVAGRDVRNAASSAISARPASPCPPRRAEDDDVEWHRPVYLRKPS